MQPTQTSLLINTHRRDNLLHLLDKLLGILIGSGPEADGRIYLGKYLSQVGIVLECWFSLGATSLVDWIMIDCE